MFLLALALMLPAGAGSLAGDASSLGEQPSSEGGETDLAAPLVKLATSPSEVAQIRTAYAAGQVWGQAQLADEEARVSDAVERLYAVLELEASAGAEPVPEALGAPLAALVSLQAHHAAGSGPFSGLTSDGGHAFTLGVLDPVISAFEEARRDAPEEPVFVDPLGLVVIGGSGDDVYTPKQFATSWSKGPVLVVEPAGDDEYRVPVAGPTSFTAVRDAPVDPGIQFQFATVALELGGNDTYTEQTASADFGGPASQAILLDRHGDDAYGSTDIKRTTAYGGPGFGYLLDEEGDDTYLSDGHMDPHPQIRDDGGIAYAYRGGTAVLWDQQGHDSYIAGDDAWFSHGVAHSREAKALLWDEEGADTYNADFYAYGSAWNDAYARFVDEEGDDVYAIQDPDFAFGSRYEELVSLRGDTVLGQGLGEFIDASGSDTYDWQWSADDHPPPSNGKVHVDHRDDRKHGVFIDCQTPADADRPCEEEQHQARCTMLRHPTDVRSEVEPFVGTLLDPIEDECRSLGS